MKKITTILALLVSFCVFGQNPGGVPGAQVWLKADGGVNIDESGNNVTEWVNQGTSGGTAVAAGSFRTPPTIPGYPFWLVNKHNFNPAVRANINAQYGFVLPDVFPTVAHRDLQIFAVQSMPNVLSFSASVVGFSRMTNVQPDINNENPVLRTAGPNGWGVWWNTPGLINQQAAFPNSLVRYNDVPTINELIAPMWVGSAYNFTIGMNGTRTPLPQFNIIPQAGYEFGAHLTLFTDGGMNNLTDNSTISEIISYGNTVLTAAQQNQVNSYLAVKYGITLLDSGGTAAVNYHDASGNIIWEASLNPSHNNNIFGLGRDEASALQQKVSKSVNPGSILTIATTNDFVNPNDDEARRSFTNDKTYFLLGDNGITATTTVDVPAASTLTKRIQRVWLSQRTNTTGSIHFSADLSAYGPDFDGAVTVYMIIADDEDFTTNLRKIPATFIDNKWESSYNFDTQAANQYISYAIDEASLPVVFNSFTAEQLGQSLIVKWETASEANNSHFLIQVSKDGKNFQTVRTVNSKAIDGNSGESIMYEVSLSLNNTELSAVYPLAIIAFLGLILIRKKSVWKTFAGISMVLGIMFIIGSCSKNNNAELNNDSKLFVRIAQVDKDSTVSYSKVIKPVME